MSANQKVILLVEDDPDLRRLTTDLLGFQNYHVLQAESSTQALKILEEERPDLILTDISLPDMSGITLTRKIRAQAHLDDIPILVLTASATKADLEAAIEAGSSGYISKPVDIQKLFAEIQDLIS